MTVGIPFVCIESDIQHQICNESAKYLAKSSQMYNLVNLWCITYFFIYFVDHLIS